ncbi:MAG TPA: dihydropteroate synthase [Vicinamibacterales bacterium]|nr:dihydropteroate synthase [Vicinamibacterales bacterium]
MVNPRPRFAVPLPGRAPLALGERTLVMGIINVTPDSFADGGLRFDRGRAVADGLQMIADGADILDVGGESTRPGASPLPEDEELARVLPVVERLVREGSVPVSVDTYKAAVAREAIARGAALVNDVSGLLYEPALAAAVAGTGAALVLMHTRGRSRDMYQHASYADAPAEIAHELSQSMRTALDGGVPTDSLVLDPGVGFAKRAEHSWQAIARLDVLAALGRPILVGPSRKSYLESALGSRPAAGREWGTAAAVAAAVLAGAHIVRVHGVREMADVVRVADRIRAAAIQH